MDIRYEGETMIIPVLEEMLTVEKRLLLKEELHVTRRPIETRYHETVTVRSEDVHIKRLAAHEQVDADGTESAS